MLLSVALFLSSANFNFSTVDILRLLWANHLNVFQNFFLSYGADKGKDERVESVDTVDTVAPMVILGKLTNYFHNIINLLRVEC